MGTMHYPIKVAIAGLGHRGYFTYAKCLYKIPEKMELVAAADPRTDRHEMAQKEFGLSPESCFSSVEEMLKCDKLADVMIIATQDRQHVAQAIRAMEKGYDILVEKPISPDLEECQKLLKVANSTGKKVAVCHVLRYTPFYTEVKRLLDSGEIGDVVSIQHIENVRYWHQAHSYVRGNWRKESETSPMILAKCCHDTDLLLWLTGQHCRSVSSCGGRYLFRKEMAPEGAPDRCTSECRARAVCPYDAVKIYMTNPETGILHGKTGWPCEVLANYPTPESIWNALENGPYGRCVYACDNDVVDHQAVNMEMESGASFQITMSAFTAKGGRDTRIMGTLGEIEACMDTNTIIVRPFGCDSRTIDVSTLATDFSGHAGGDFRLVEEFLDYVAGAKMLTSRMTTLEASMESHFVALAAEQSRLQGGKAVLLNDIRNPET